MVGSLFAKHNADFWLIQTVDVCSNKLEVGR